MKSLGLLVSSLVLAGIGLSGGHRHPAAAQFDPASSTLELKGKTEPAFGLSALIAPSELESVDEVLVRVGDRVKKGQVLVKLEQDEPKADLDSKKAAVAELRASLNRLKSQPREEERNEARSGCECCKLAVESARKQVERLEPLWRTGSVSDQNLQAARIALLRAVAEERSASARLDRLLKQPVDLEIGELEARLAAAEATVTSAQAAFDDFTIRAPLDGVVSWLDVRVGMVSKPGTTVWGEILDLSEVDVRCDVSPAKVDQIAIGQQADVTVAGRNDGSWSGKVTAVSLAGDPNSGQIPVFIRVRNDAGPMLRSRVPVIVRLQMK